MVYNAEISVKNPTCFIFLIDQSGSMNDQVGDDLNKNKAQAVADAINRLLMETAIRCTKDDGVRNYIYVSVIGYGKNVGSAFAGPLANRDLIPINEVVNNPAEIVTRQKDDGAGGLVTIRFPVWFYPVAESYTPMCEALSYAKTLLVNQWLPKHPDSFPPLIFNITDGESTDGNPFNIAEEIKKMATTDGNILLFNVHLSPTSANPFIFPDKQESLPDEYAKLLFSMSSNLTPQMQELAKESGYSDISNTSKGFVYNTEIISLIRALTIGTAWTLGTRRSLQGEKGIERNLPPIIHLDNTNSLKVSESICIDNESSKNPIIKSTSRSLVNVDSSVSTEKFHQNAQFTVFRPSAILPEKWYSLLFFAHLAARSDDAQEDEPDPLEEVERQAREILQDEINRYSQLRQDSSQSLPKEGQLTLVPHIDGIVCNPPKKIFYWYEPVHREIFRIKTTKEYTHKICRGGISVYFGSICVADIPISIKVTNNASAKSPAITRNSAQVYRKIFASYSHRDEKIVEEFEKYTLATGDKFLRDSMTLRTGEIWNERIPELIKEADIFQLFWSNNSMYSPYVQQEWEYAITLNRPYFIRPVFWDDPLPEDKEKRLPPQELLKFHFHKLSGTVIHASDSQDVDIQEGRELATLRGHTVSANSVAVTPNGLHLVSGSTDTALKVWDQERENSVSMKCPKCKLVNYSTAKFCRKCGYTLTGSTSPQSTTSMNTQLGGTAKDLLSQISIASPEQPHFATLLLLDTSGSMVENGKIEKLNDGMRFLKEEILRDELASSRVDIAVVTFGDGVVEVVHPFTSIRDFQPPLLSAKGDSPMGEAILQGIDLVETRKKIYRGHGVNYFRPWIFMITDGEPSDMKKGDQKWAIVKSSIEDCEKNGKLMFFSVGVEPAKMNLLNDLMPPTRGAFKLRQGNFRDMFQWLSNSQEKVLISDLGPGERVKFESIDGWGDLSIVDKDQDEAINPCRKMEQEPTTCNEKPPIHPKETVLENMTSGRIPLHKVRDVLYDGSHEALAQQVYEHYLKTNPSFPKGKPWSELPNHQKDSYQQQANDIFRKLWRCGYTVCLARTRPVEPFLFKPEEVEIMAIMEHERWMDEKSDNGWTCGERNEFKKTHPCLVGWEELPEIEKDKDREYVKIIPALLISIDFEIVKDPLNDS